MNATEASRGFSSALTRAAGGEVIEIDRHGQVVAVLSPAHRAFVSGTAVRELLTRALPDDLFADDVRALASVTAQPRDAWQP